jgi:branched-chain amino acid transport system permease protein
MSEFLSIAISILFHGLAMAMVLYLISVGLSVTMGLMGFVNLAHGAFAMAGGYTLVILMKQQNLPFGVALAAAIIICVVISLILERLLYRRLYGGDELDQVLMTMGLIFASVGAATWLFGPVSQSLEPPAMLRGQIHFLGRDFPTYRSFLILCGALLVTALWLGLERTRFGAQIRASVDNLRMAQTLGINTSRLFTIAFGLGSGLAALGGGLGADLLNVGPNYALEYLVYFLIVVAVGGLGSIRGPFVAALIVGVSDTAFKYLAPQYGAFFIYAITMAILLWRPRGLFGQSA